MFLQGALALIAWNKGENVTIILRCYDSFTNVMWKSDVPFQSVKIIYFETVKLVEKDEIFRWKLRDFASGQWHRLKLYIIVNWPILHLNYTEVWDWVPSQQVWKWVYPTSTSLKSGVPHVGMGILIDLRRGTGVPSG